MANRKNRVIVTGAAGFVGSAVVDRLSGRYDAIACDREAPRNPSAAAEFIPLDVNSTTVCPSLLRRSARNGCCTSSTARSPWWCCGLASACYRIARPFEPPSAP
jgi:NAD(P)-dependent dehydrogenase (short-subunit alcohol dehydrogenase family)